MSVEGGVQLTEHLIFSKAKAQSLQQIKNLNLWSCDLQDLKLLRKMPQLQVLSLSVNKVRTLADFSFCPALQELYLRKNLIKDLRQIKFLAKLPSLKILWLSQNPCAKAPNYRMQVIKALPQLIRLDNENITEAQREAASKLRVEEEERQSKALTPVPNFSNVTNLSNVPEKSLSKGVSKPQVPKTARSTVMQAILLLTRQLRPEELRELQSELSKLAV